MSFRAILVFLAALAYFLLFHRYGFFLQDEGVIAYQALRVSRGQVPYADFQTAYTPGAFYVHALLFDLFGPSLPLLRVAGAVVGATTTALLAVAAARVLPLPWALLPSLLFAIVEDQASGGFVVHTIPYPNRYVEALWAGSLCLTLAYLRRPARGLACVLGLVTATIGAFKHTAGIFDAWAVGLCIILVAMVARDGAPERAAASAPGVLHRLLTLVPAVFLLLLLGALPLLAGGLGGVGVTELFVLYLPLVVAAILLLRASNPLARGAEAARRRDVLATAGGDLLCFALCVVAATAAWVVAFGTRVGFGLLLRRLILDGPSAAQSYAISFPAPGALAVAGAAVVVAAVGVRWSASRGPAAARRAMRAFGILCGVFTVAFMAWAGLTLFQTMRMEQAGLAATHVGREIDNLAFYLVPAISWAFVPQLRRELARRGPGSPVLVCWLHGVCQFFLAYPRLDVSHLYGGVPILLVPGTVLLVRAIGFFRDVAAPRRARWVSAGAAAAVAVVCVVKLAPRIDAQFGWNGGPELSARTAIAGPRGGLYGTEFDAGWLTALNRTVEFVDRRTAPGTPIFAYPALPGIYFLTGRENPSPLDYFYRGFGEGRDEVAVVQALEDSQVPIVVRMGDHAYDPEEESHYPVLKDYLRRHFVQTHLFAPFRIFERVAP